MQLKMYQIIDFPVFFSKVKSQKLSFKTSYRLAILAQEIEKHVNFYHEKFQELVNNYSAKNENGNPIPTDDGQGVILKEETMTEAYERLSELRDLDIELPDTKFAPEDFESIELSPVEMNVILPFIEE